MWDSHRCFRYSASDQIESQHLDKVDSRRDIPSDLAKNQFADVVGTSSTVARCTRI